MDLTQLTLNDLRAISTLLERKEGLQSQIEEIDRQLLRYAGGAEPSEAKASRRAARRPARSPGGVSSPNKAPRGQLKESIVKALKEAGPEGLSVKELVDLLGSKYRNVTVWFQTTGKKISKVRKVGRARFAWVESPSA